jgi:hypothetical protein
VNPARSTRCARGDRPGRTDARRGRARGRQLEGHRVAQELRRAHPPAGPRRRARQVHHPLHQIAQPPRLGVNEVELLAREGDTEHARASLAHAARLAPAEPAVVEAFAQCEGPHPEGKAAREKLDAYARVPPV